MRCQDCYYWGDTIKESETGLPLAVESGCTVNFKPMEVDGCTKCQAYTERKHILRLMGYDVPVKKAPQ